MEVNAKQIPVSEIAIGARHRKDAGDVSDLCRSIGEVGLLHPVVITPDKTLVAGLRRLAAFRQMNISKIPAVIVSNLDDARSLLIAERDENDCRKPFTTLEAVAMGRALEDLERPAAEARQQEGRKHGRGGKKHGENFTPSSGGKVRDKIGEAIGMSGVTFQRAKAVAIAAEQEPEVFGPIAEEMEATGKVVTAFNKVQDIKAKKRPADVEPPKDRNGRQPVGVLRANEAIDCLMKIPKNDPHRARAFQIVSDWIRHNK